MKLDFLGKPIYGLRAAEVWKEVSGNYPLLPANLKEGDGAVLLISQDSKHIVGFFGFGDIKDQVLLFDSFLLAEQFFKIAKENPRMFKNKPLNFISDEVAAEEPVAEVVGRPRHAFEGSGLQGE